MVDNKITCSHALVQGVVVGAQIRNCPTYGSNNAAGTELVSGTYNIVCASGHGATWKYASAHDGGMYDMFAGTGDTDDDASVAVKSTSVLVVGGGAGAWAAAAAIRHAHPSISMAVVSAGGSTTSMSTGVVWFPDKTQHTPHRLKQAAGGENIDERWLQEYIDEGTVTFEYAVRDAYCAGCAK